MKKLSILWSIVLCFGLSIGASANAQDRETGKASVFGEAFHGRKTAYNIVYNKNEMVAAHKSHASGTQLRVTNQENRKSVVVTVIDQGAMIQGIIVQLSSRAARAINIADGGQGRVLVERITKAPPIRTEIKSNTPPPAEIPKSYDEVKNPSTAGTSSSPSSSTAANAVREPAPVKEAELKTPPPATPDTRSDAASPSLKPGTETTSKGVSKAAAPVATAKSETANSAFKPVDSFTPTGIYRIQIDKPKSTSGYAVQVGVYSNYENMLNRVAFLQSKGYTNTLVSFDTDKAGKDSFKVLVGPSATEADANKVRVTLKNKYRISGFAVNLADVK